MLFKRTGIIVYCLVLLAGCDRCSQRESLPLVSDVEVINKNPLFVFQTLDEGILAQSGNFQLTFDEGFSPQIDFLKKQKRELLILLSYQQFFLGVKKPAKKIVFHFEKPNDRSLQAAFNQYGVPFLSQVDLQFDPSLNPKKVCTVDGQSYSEGDLNSSKLYWGANQTQIFRESLKLVKKRILQKALEVAAVGQGLGIKDYVRSQVLKGKDFTPTPKEVESYRISKNLQGKPEDLTVQELRKKAELKFIDEFAEKNFIKRPIVVNLAPPHFDFELKYDWTPSLGPANSAIKVIFFTDFLAE